MYFFVLKVLNFSSLERHSSVAMQYHVTGQSDCTCCGALGGGPGGRRSGRSGRNCTSSDIVA